MKLWPLCLLASVAFCVTAQAEVARCGRLSLGVVEDKNGDYTHRGLIYRRSDAGGELPLATIGSLGEPVSACLRESALLVQIGHPVEADIAIVFFANGQSVVQLAKEVEVDIRDGRATVRRPILLQHQDPEKVPADFRDLFEFR
jgi:hypothetical protein